MIALEMQLALEEAGATVELAMTAETALSRLEQRVFDAAVLDVNLGHDTACADVAARPAQHERALLGRVLAGFPGA